MLLFYEMGFSMLKARTASTLKWFVRTPIGMVDAVGGVVSAALARAAALRRPGVHRRLRSHTRHVTASTTHMVTGKAPSVAQKPPENGVEQRDAWRALRTDVHGSRDQL